MVPFTEVAVLPEIKILPFGAESATAPRVAVVVRAGQPARRRHGPLLRLEQPDDFVERHTQRLAHIER